VETREAAAARAKSFPFIDGRIEELEMLLKQAARGIADAGHHGGKIA